jgi:hypothetical protein
MIQVNILRVKSKVLEHAVPKIGRRLLVQFDCIPLLHDGMILDADSSSFGSSVEGKVVIYVGQCRPGSC